MTIFYPENHLLIIKITQCTGTSMENYRGTFVEIDLKAIRHNLETVRKIAPSSKILIAIKADAYGHGGIETGRYVEENHLADFFGVASIEEGIELRQAGIKNPILILGLIFAQKDAVDAVIENNLIISVAKYSWLNL